jgi:hypothetical protein
MGRDLARVHRLPAVSGPDCLTDSTTGSRPWTTPGTRDDPGERSALKQVAMRRPIANLVCGLVLVLAAIGSVFMVGLRTKSPLLLNAVPRDRPRDETEMWPPCPRCVRAPNEGRRRSCRGERGTPRAPGRLARPFRRASRSTPPEALPARRASTSSWADRSRS